VANDQRTCYRCKQPKSAGDFITRVDDRHYRMCRACVSEVLQARPGQKKGRLPHTETHRTCYLCRRLLPNGAFTRRRGGSYFSACKECNRHVFAQRRRARLAEAGGSYTVAEWRELVARHDRCPDCAGIDLRTGPRWLNSSAASPRPAPPPPRSEGRPR
jgi:hypothetical protein